MSYHFALNVFLGEPLNSINWQHRLEKEKIDLMNTITCWQQVHFMDSVVWHFRIDCISKTNGRWSLVGWKVSLFFQSSLWQLNVSVIIYSSFELDWFLNLFRKNKFSSQSVLTSHKLYIFVVHFEASICPNHHVFVTLKLPESKQNV